MIDGKNVFDQSINSNPETYEKRNNFITGCLLDYYFFNNYHKMIAMDLSKQQFFDPYLRVIH